MFGFLLFSFFINVSVKETINIIIMDTKIIHLDILKLSPLFGIKFLKSTLYWTLTTFSVKIYTQTDGIVIGSL